MIGGGGRGSRPHRWPCRHCDMVDDYRLNREAQIQLAEGVFRQDEDYQLDTFKDWLRTFEWPRYDPAGHRVEQDWPAQDWAAAEWAAVGWADGSTAAESVGDGRGTDEAGEQRREQLTRWHHGDTRTGHAEDGYADGEAWAS